MVVFLGPLGGGLGGMFLLVFAFIVSRSGLLWLLMADCLDRFWGVLERLCRPLGPSWRHLGTAWRDLGEVLGRSREVAGGHLHTWGRLGAAGERIFVSFYSYAGTKTTF